MSATCPPTMPALPAASAISIRTLRSAWASEPTRREDTGRGRHPRRGPAPPCSSARPRSSLPVLVPLEGLGPEETALVLGQELDALLGLLEVLGAATGESHAFLEDLERVLERQLARLEAVHDLPETLEGVLKLHVAHPVPGPPWRG